MKGWLLICVLSLLTSMAYGQRKKADKYAEYWALEAKKERYDSAMTLGNVLFEKDLLDSAKHVYKAAVNIWPEGQEAQAKIRDIQILKERRKKETPMSQPAEKPIVTTNLKTTKSIETVADSILVLEKEVKPLPVEKSFPAIREAKKVDTIVTKKKKVQPKPESKPQKIAPQKLEVKEAKPDTLYKAYHASSTVEEHKTKTVWVGVVIADGQRTEYRRVQHNYGAVFYFKDGVSISRIRFLDEATPHFEDDNLK